MKAMGGLKAGFHLLSTFTKSYHMPDTVLGYRQLWKKKNLSSLSLSSQNSVKDIQ